jgi:hypothetical protein
VRREGKDKLWCTPSNKRMFDVRSFYRALHVMMAFLFLGRVFDGPRFL